MPGYFVLACKKEKIGINGGYQRGFYALVIVILPSEDLKKIMTA